MVLPVSGVIPSMVRMISNCIFDEMSRAENSYNGDSSSENLRKKSVLQRSWHIHIYIYASCAVLQISTIISCLFYAR